MKYLILLFATCSVSTLFSQNLSTKSPLGEYPDGLYASFSDFVAKTPNKEANFEIKQGQDTISFRFIKKDSGKKERKAFAIAQDGKLYIRIKAMRKYFNSESKNQNWDGGNYFLKATTLGKFIYMQDFFTSTEAAFWGGLIGGSAARREKAIIYSPENKEFILFKNYKFFTRFIEKKYPDLLPDALQIKKEDISEIEKVKKVLEKIHQ